VNGLGVWKEELRGVLWGTVEMARLRDLGLRAKKKRRLWRGTCSMGNKTGGKDWVSNRGGKVGGAGGNDED